MRLRFAWIVCLIGLMLTMSSCQSPTTVDPPVVPDEPVQPVQGVVLRGIDISHHNVDGYGAIDWAQVRAAGSVFAFVKATEGYNGCWTDATFTTNIERGHAAGLFMGAYHFARPDLNKDAAIEAACFLRVAGPYLTSGHLRPVLDIETGAALGKAQLSAWVQTWLTTVKNRTGLEPLIYTYSSFTKNFDVALTKYSLWVAHYTGSVNISPNTGIWATWDFWQYTDNGSSAGVSDPSIDLNLFNGDLARLQREFVIP